MLETDQRWKILDSIQAQIRAFDTKAQVVIAIVGVLIAFTGSQIANLTKGLALCDGESIRWTVIGAGSLCIALLLAALCFGVVTLRARIEFGQKRSILFFGHLVQEYKTNYEAHSKHLDVLSEEELRYDLATQILANSNIAARKARFFKYSLYVLSVAFLAWIVMLPGSVLLQREMAIHDFAASKTAGKTNSITPADSCIP